ncbi:MAG: SdrD B-like domain-containing protein, partial [Chloroflexota bacterium]
EATAGLPNVQLSLFLVPAGYTVGDSPIDATGATTSFTADADNNGIPDGAFATTLTNANGYYIFDYLPEGNYVVQVDPLNFSANTGTTTNAGGALYDAPNMFPYFSSEDTDTSFIPANNDTDLRDDGIDENNPQTNGVRSNRYTLSRNAEPSVTVPTDDRDLDATAGEGTNGELDANANMTVDFEFNAAIPMSIGNRVFYDYNNNGIFDGTDVGIQGVIVRLYSVDAAGNVVGGGQIDDPSDALRQVTTGANGEYIFDGLQRGTYRVVLAEENFRNGALLDNYQSSTNVNGNLVDNNGDSADVAGFENGGSVTVGSQADNLNPENQGIISPIITLTPGTEPQNETFKFDTDTPADGIPDDGQPNVEDSNGDMTQDFGVYKPQSIGNRVWFDTNNDGLISTGESGVANVTVSLYVDEGNGVYDGTEALAQLADITMRTVVPAQEQTDANGYYLFDNVPPGQYFVVIEDTNFATGQPLAGVSSTTTGIDNPSFTPPAGFNNPDDDDSNDNGVDTPVAGDIHSELIDLTRPYDDLITTEPDLSNNATNDGPSNIGRNGETDNNSDLTIDFGFTSPNMSLGNRVWYDEDGNGVIDTNNRFGNDESAGIDGVNVSLYRDNDGNGIPDGAAIALDTTGNGGYYLFENLAPGRYVVGIDNSNFNAGNPLNGLISTLTTADNPADNPTTDPNTGVTFINPDDDDSNDNGRDVRNATYGVLSNTVTLTRDSERSGEADTEAGVGNGTGVDADDSDLTVDFGFFEPMSLGNRVWLDNDNSGLIDNGEVGVSGVTVYLFRTDGAGNIIDADGDGTGSTTDDTNGDNIPDDAIDSDVTDAEGYYLFDGLPPGTYIIAVDGQAFGIGQPLAGTASSTTDGVPTVDSDDDGITVDANGNVLSTEITLNTRDSGINEPTGETDL